MNTPHQPMPLIAAPDPVDRDLEPLLQEPFASALASETATAPAPLRGRLLDRLAASRLAASAMVTARRSQQPTTTLAPGVVARSLYVAGAARALRPGEPLLARCIEFAAGSTWQGPPPERHREWLVVQGAVRIGARLLRLRDYHVAPAGCAAEPLTSDSGGVLFLRESNLAADAGDQAQTVGDDTAGWPDFAPGIQRRVLWHRGGQAAMLYYAQPGAAVPLHSHGHDEECLMVQGELFLDDLLLREGEYQLAPAGTSHRITQTDTGVVLYAHGDLDLRFVD